MQHTVQVMLCARPLTGMTTLKGFNALDALAVATRAIHASTESSKTGLLYPEIFG